MGGGNGRKKVLMPGQEMPQGQVLQPGGMTPQELESRRSLEYDYIIGSNLNQAVGMAGEIVKKYDSEGPFKDFPEGKRQRQEALEVHSDLVDMQLRLLRTIRGKMKKCKPFSGMKDLRFGDMDNAEEV